MKYSISQYRNTKKEIIENFNNLPNGSYVETDQKQNFNGYLVILNLINSSKNNNLKKKKNLKMNKLRVCTTSRAFKAQKFKFMSQIDQPTTTLTGIYLTEHQFNSRVQKSTQNLTQPIKIFQKKKQDYELKKLENKVIMEKNVTSNLNQQIIVMEQCINHYKKQICKLQHKKHRQFMREKNYINLLVDYKEQLGVKKYNNDEMKVNLSKTTRHFEKMYKGILKQQIEVRNKNQDKLDQVTDKILLKKKMKLQIKNQIKIIEKLNQQSKKIKNQIKNGSSLIVKKNFLTKIYQLSERMLKESSCIESINQINRDNILHNNELSFDQNRSLEEIAKQLEQLYDKMQIECKQSNELYLMAIQQNKQALDQLNHLQKEQNNYKNLQIQSLKLQTDSIQNQIDFSQQIEIKHSVLEKKVKKIGLSIIEMENRLVFFLRKQFNLLKSIIKTWLIYDSSATSFIEEIQEQLLHNINQNKESLSHFETLRCLQASFQKSTKYMIYHATIHQNPITYYYLSKNTFSHYLKRIVKTKIKNPKMRTEKIFTVSLQLMQKQALECCESHLKQLFHIILRIYHFTKTFQDLIVNNRQSSNLIILKNHSNEVQKQNFQERKTQYQEQQCKQEQVDINFQAQKKQNEQHESQQIKLNFQQAFKCKNVFIKQQKLNKNYSHDFYHYLQGQIEGISSIMKRN